MCVILFTESETNVRIVYVLFKCLNKGLSLCFFLSSVPACSYIKKMASPTTKLIVMG